MLISCDTPMTFTFIMAFSAQGALWAVGRDLFPRRYEPRPGSVTFEAASVLFEFLGDTNTYGNCNGWMGQQFRTFS